MPAPLRRSHRALLAGLTGLCLALAGGCDDEPSARGPSGLEADPFVELSEPELGARIREARAEAQRSGRLVLLDFLADWCTDCREVVRLLHEEPARSALESRFVIVYVDIGTRELHPELQREHSVDRITTLVVLDPASGERLARTTLEPITGAERGLTSEGLASWLVTNGPAPAVQRQP